MTQIDRIAADNACRRTGAGCYDILCADPDQYFIRSVATGQLIGSRNTLSGATAYARGQAAAYDRACMALPIAA